MLRCKVVAAVQVIKEVEGALDGWKTGGRYKDMGILDQVRLGCLLCAAPPVKKLEAAFTAVPVIVCPHPGPGVRLCCCFLWPWL